MPDNMTLEQRRLTMSRIRKADTKPEITVRRLVFARGLRFRKCVSGLPGTPDLVFAGARVAVFIDGDFWHGWRFDEWEHKLSSTYWKDKIAGNRRRDSQHDARLKDEGWSVIRIWEHEVEEDPEACVRRVEAAVRAGQRKMLGTAGRSAKIQGRPRPRTLSRMASPRSASCRPLP